MSNENSQPIETVPGLISVVITCYNYARFLTEAVESILQQDYPHFEVLVVDDGSKDESLEVANALAIRDDRVKVLAKENGGISSARNLGITSARGEFICLLDADDVYAPGRFSRQVAYMNEHPDCRILYGDEQRGNSDFSQIEPFPKGNPPRVLTEFLIYRPWFGPFNALFRAEAMREIGLFRKPLEHAEDWDFWQRCRSKGGFHYQAGLVGTYRIHGAQATTSGQGIQNARARVLRANVPLFSKFGPTAWGLQCWYCAKGHRARKEVLPMLGYLFLLIPHALIPGRIRMFDTWLGL